MVGYAKREKQRGIKRDLEARGGGEDAVPNLLRYGAFSEVSGQAIRARARNPSGSQGKRAGAHDIEQNHKGEA